MLRAIAEYQITGIETTLAFGRYVLEHPAFISGNFDTNFIRDHFPADALKPAEPDEAIAKVAAVLGAMLMTDKKPAVVASSDAPVATGSAWKRNRLGVR
jgi:acetyl/propionyl-CoA carboxylase alpha subunit